MFEVVVVELLYSQQIAELAVYSTKLIFDKHHKESRHLEIDDERLRIYNCPFSAAGHRGPSNSEARAQAVVAPSARVADYLQLQTRPNELLFHCG